MSGQFRQRVGELGGPRRIRTDPAADLLRGRREGLGPLRVRDPWTVPASAAAPSASRSRRFAGSLVRVQRWIGARLPERGVGGSPMDREHRRRRLSAAGSVASWRPWPCAGSAGRPPCSSGPSSLLDRGSGITLFPNAMRALDAIGVGTASASAGAPVPMARAACAGRTARWSSTASTVPPVAGLFVFHRADLHRRAAGASSIRACSGPGSQVTAVRATGGSGVVEVVDGEPSDR